MKKIFFGIQRGDDIRTYLLCSVYLCPLGRTDYCLSLFFLPAGCAKQRALDCGARLVKRNSCVRCKKFSRGKIEDKEGLCTYKNKERPPSIRVQQQSLATTNGFWPVQRRVNEVHRKEATRQLIGEERGGGDGDKLEGGREKIGFESA